VLAIARRAFASSWFLFGVEMNGQISDTGQDAAGQDAAGQHAAGQNAAAVPMDTNTREASLAPTTKAPLTQKDANALLAIANTRGPLSAQPNKLPDDYWGKEPDLSGNKKRSLNSNEKKMVKANEEAWTELTCAILNYEKSHKSLCAAKAEKELFTKFVLEKKAKDADREEKKRILKRQLEEIVDEERKERPRKRKQKKGKTAKEPQTAKEPKGKTAKEPRAAEMDEAMLQARLDALVAGVPLPVESGGDPDESDDGDEVLLLPPTLSLSLVERN